MKLGRIAHADIDGDTARLVAIEPDANRVVDLRIAARIALERRGASPSGARRLAGAWFPGSMREAISAGDAFLEAAADAVAQAGDDASQPLDEVDTWLSPIDPLVFRDALVFEQHLLTQFKKADIKVPGQYYRAPAYYKGNPTTLVGHDVEIPWPYETKFMDYELEVGFVLGASGRDLTPEEAESHLFGVTVFNDFSARDIQAYEMSARLGPAKGKDFATALGPWITTVDEVDINNLEMVARVNGEEWSRGNSGDMMWSPAEIVAYLSQFEPTDPGEVIGSGTVGTGSGADLDRKLSPGDVVELEISGIGVLRNRVGEPQASRWWPEPKPRPKDDA